MPIVRIETSQVTKAKEALLMSLEASIFDQKLTRDEAEASLSYFFSGAWNEIEQKVVRKLTDRAWAPSATTRARKDVKGPSTGPFDDGF